MGCYQTKENWKLQDLSRFKFYFNQAEIRYSKRQFLPALNDFEKALSIVKKSSNEDLLLLAKCYHSLANTHYEIKHNDRAIQLYERTIRCYSNSIVKTQNNSAEIVELFQKLAKAHSSVENYSKAIEYNKKALDILLLCMKRDSITYPILLYNLAGLYLKTGCYNECIDHIKTCLYTLRTQKEEKNSLVVKCYNCIGLAYKLIGNSAKSIEYYEVGIEKSQDCEDVDSLDIAAAYSNLALVQKDMQQFEEAFNNLIRCLEIEHDYLPDTHPRIEGTIRALQYICIFYKKGESILENLLKQQKIDMSNGRQSLRSLETGRKFSAHSSQVEIELSALINSS